MSQAEIEALINSMAAGDAAGTGEPAGPTLLSDAAVAQYGNLQAEVWESVSVIASEAAGRLIAFGEAATVRTTPTDAFAAYTEPTLYVQFSFSSVPRSAQALIIPTDTAIAIANWFAKKPATEFGEKLVESVTPTLEALVQGLCMGLGKIKDEVVSPADVTIQFQPFAPPDSLAAAAELIKAEVPISSEGFEGSLIWITDQETVQYLVGAQFSAAAPEPTTIFHPATVQQSDDCDEGVNVDRILDVSLDISVELARMKMMMKDAAALSTGSIVETERSVGEPVDVIVDGCLVARGEVVVVDEYFGVRITEIFNSRDRLKQLLFAS